MDQIMFYDINGYEGLYQINKKGEIRSKKTKKIMKQRISSWGYHSVNLRKDGKYHSEFIHKLLARQFIENPENKNQVNHKDGVKTNNDISNLEWCTPSENHQHKQDMRLQKTNGKQKKATVTEIYTHEVFIFSSLNSVSKFFGFKKSWVQARMKRFGTSFIYENYKIEVIENG